MKFNLKILILAGLTFAAANLLHMNNATSDTQITEKTKELGRDTKRGAKKAARKVQDETCEMINGKMECAAKKAKHKILNTTDDIEDAVE